MRKFGREKNIRRSFLKSLAANLILKEKIKTTEARAKDLRSFAERLITVGKKGDLVARRKTLKFLPSQAAKKLVKEIGPRFKDRNGGYTRIINLGQRMSDGAKIVYIELVK